MGGNVVGDIWKSCTTFEYSWKSRPRKVCPSHPQTKKERARNKIDRILFGISIINICWNAIFSNAENINFTDSSLLLWKLMKIWKVGGLIFIYFNLKSRSNNLNYRTKFRTKLVCKTSEYVVESNLNYGSMKRQKLMIRQMYDGVKKEKEKKKNDALNFIIRYRKERDSIPIFSRLRDPRGQLYRRPHFNDA